MRAMILAAGLGTRLRPLTDDRPKALVEVNGHTMLAMTLASLRAFGVREVIVNAHHFAAKIVEYLKAHDNFGMHIEVSREEVLLDTGGGLKKAAPFFLRDGSDEPFLLHNVDVISTIDLDRMLRVHRNRGALATLAVQQRTSSRQLLFDDQLRLCGRRAEGQDELVRSATHLQPLAFCGIHVISPKLFSRMSEEGIFSIISVYLRLAASETIAAFRAEEYYWRDLGTPEGVRGGGEDAACRILSKACDQMLGSGSA